MFLYCFCTCVSYTSSDSCLLFRCVLAASSPVLASILSSAGVLVELQAPCLSDSVLAHVLDYIYTGALPCTQSHQQYSSLFTAACYLKMEELQRTLETQVNHLQLSVSCTGASLESTWEDHHRGTATTSRSHAERTLQGVNTGQITISSSKKLANVVPDAAETCRVFRMGTEVQHYQFHSARPTDPESWLQSTEMPLRTAVENKTSSAKEGAASIVEATQQLCLMAAPGPQEAQAHSREEQICYTPCCVDSSSPCSRVTSPSSSSPHPSCGAVPVIRHSSAATAAEACAGSSYHLVPMVSGSNGGIFEDISSQGGAHNGSFDYRSDDRAGHDSPPKCSSAEEQTHSQDPQTVLPLPLQGPDTGSISQCPTDRDKLPSTPSPNITEKHTEDPAFECDDTADDNEDRDKLQLLATSTLRVDNTCDPAYSVVEQSYHAHLHYHCLHQEDTLFSHRTSAQNHSHQDLPDRASDEDEDGPFASAAQHLTPADQVLLLDISTKPPELLISYRYDEQGDWAPLGQGTSGKQRDGDAAETVSDGSDAGPVDRDADAKSTDKTSETPGDLVKDPDDGENYTLRCAPSCVPDSLHGPTSPTSSFCIPSAISANMPTIVSPQLSNHHPFQCSMCHRSFSQRGSLNRHMRSHLGIRPFPCPRCPMTFSRQYRVSEHMRVHQRCVLGNDFQKPPASST